MLSPFAFDQTKHLGARAVESIGIDIDAIDAFGKGFEAEGIRQPVREIVGAQMKAETRRNEVEVKGGVAEVGDGAMKFLEVRGGQTEGKVDFNTFAEVEALKRLLPTKFGVLLDEFADDPAQVGAESGDRSVIADVESGELFGEGIAISVCENPLREVVGETFGEVMVTAESLKGVMEDRGVGAVFEAVEELGKGTGGVIADASQSSDGEELEGGFSRTQGSTSWLESRVISG
jgi:hypothetical protein